MSVPERHHEHCGLPGHRPLLPRPVFRPAAGPGPSPRQGEWLRPAEGGGRGKHDGGCWEDHAGSALQSAPFLKTNLFDVAGAADRPLAEDLQAGPALGGAAEHGAHRQDQAEPAARISVTGGDVNSCLLVLLDVSAAGRTSGSFSRWW